MTIVRKAIQPDVDSMIGFQIFLDRQMQQKINARRLDPAVDAARVRAMYTDPTFARRGVGRVILTLCEVAAAAEGFTRVQLMATLAGEPLYRACGYEEIERTAAAPVNGVAVPLVLMGKALPRATPPGSQTPPP